MIRVLAAAAVVAAAVAGCTPAPSPSPPPTGTVPTAGITRAVPAPPAPLASATAEALLDVHDPGRVTGTLEGACRYRDHGRLPDPFCTPGAVDPQVTAAVLCSPSYRTSAYRPPASATDRFKFDVAYPAYGVADVPGTRSELDHLVPLELGGANDARNLWPELGTVPNAKDGVERALAAWVCAVSGAAGQSRLAQAQVAIARDWMTAETVLGISA